MLIACFPLDESAVLLKGTQANVKMGDRSTPKQDISRDNREREREHVRALTFTWAEQIYRPHSKLSLRNTTHKGNTQVCRYH